VKYLVDANILSEATKPSPDPRVIDWLRANEEDVAVDPIVVGELRFGILLLPKGKKRTDLKRWFDRGIQRLHCIPWEIETGLKWAELLARLRTAGKAMPLKDSLIAATALRHGLIVVTRNRSDFAAAGVKLLDPFHT
jgi:predicted nucleic acid-binding protein